MMINKNLNNNKTPLIALIGRQNVGKSTLFNWLSKRKISIINKEPGATRDRKYQLINFDGFKYRLIDTAGLTKSKNEIDKKTEKQTDIAINEADVIIFMLDAKEGLLLPDVNIASKLRKNNYRIIMAINKCDSESIRQQAYEFHSLMKSPLVMISSTQGLGIRDLFLEIKKLIPNLLIEEKKYIEKNNEKTIKIKVAVIGKQNSGKSSFINKLLNDNRLLTSDIPGTTIDIIDSNMTYNGQEYLLIDTAGIRRKRSVSMLLEKQSISATLKALDRCTVSLFLVDAEKGITEQDLKIASLIKKKNKGIIIIINKWDLVKSKKISEYKYEKQVKEKVPFLSFAPIIFTSTLSGENIFKSIDCLKVVAQNYEKRINTSQVNKWLQLSIKNHEPPIINNKQLKILYGAQISSSPPVFMLSCSESKKIHFSYNRYLINSLRKFFTFTGVPLRVLYNKRQSKVKKK